MKEIAKDIAAVSASITNGLKKQNGKEKTISINNPKKPNGTQSEENNLNGKKRKLQLDLNASDEEDSEDDIAKHIFSDDEDEEEDDDDEIVDDYGNGVSDEDDEEEEGEDDEVDDEDDDEEDDEEEDEDDDEDLNKDVKIKRSLGNIRLVLSPYNLDFL